MSATAQVLSFVDFEDDDDAFDAARKTHQTLIDTQERMGMMLDVMPMGLLIHTEQGILFANQEACRMLEVTNEAAVGQHLLDFVAQNQFTSVLEQFEASFHTCDMHSQETRLAHSSGEDLHIKLISCKLPWHGNPVIQVLLQDITDLKKTELKLRLLSQRDPLTGTYNRRFAMHEAEALLSAPNSRSLGVLIIDADHFKAVNDTYGHAAGDAALIALAEIGTELTSMYPGEQLAPFCRFGGEEFVALLPGCDVAQARDFAEQLRQRVEGRRIVGPDGEFSITVSIGVSTAQPGTSFDAALARADKALYAAKASGRNRVEIG